MARAIASSEGINAPGSSTATNATEESSPLPPVVSEV